MTKLTAYTSYADAQAHWSSAKLWELFDGDRERLNIAHECIDRHVDGDKIAVIVVKAAGGEEILSYRQISEDSARFAHWLVNLNWNGALAVRCRQRQYARGDDHSLVFR